MLRKNWRDATFERYSRRSTLLQFNYNISFFFETRSLLVPSYYYRKSLFPLPFSLDAILAFHFVVMTKPPSSSVFNRIFFNFYVPLWFPAWFALPLPQSEVTIHLRLSHTLSQNNLSICLSCSHFLTHSTVYWIVCLTMYEYVVFD